MKINQRSAFPGKDKAVGKFPDTCHVLVACYCAIRPLGPHVVGCLGKGYI